MAKLAHEADERVPLWVRGTDMDPTCARMAVLNLVIAALPGLIRHGNSLTQEVHRAWAVDPAARPVVIEVDPADVTLADGDGDDQTPGATEVEADLADWVEVQTDLGRWSG